MNLRLRSTAARIASAEDSTAGMGSDGKGRGTIRFRRGETEREDLEETFSQRTTRRRGSTRDPRGDERRSTGSRSGQAARLRKRQETGGGDERMLRLAPSENAGSLLRSAGSY